MLRIQMSEPRPWGERFSFYTVTMTGMYDNDQLLTEIEIGHATTPEGETWTILGHDHQADSFTGIMQHVANAWLIHQHQINGWARDQEAQRLRATPEPITYETFKQYASSIYGTARKAANEGNETKAERCIEEYEQLIADYPHYFTRLQHEEAENRGDYAEEYQP